MITFEQAVELKQGDTIQFENGEPFRIERVDANLKRRYVYIELSRVRDGWPTFATEHMLFKMHKVTLVSLGSDKEDTQEVEPVVEITADNQGITFTPDNYLVDDEPSAADDDLESVLTPPAPYDFAGVDEPLAADEPEPAPKKRGRKKKAE